MDQINNGDDKKQNWRERLTKLEDDLKELIEIENRRRENLFHPVYMEKPFPQNTKIGYTLTSCSSCVLKKQQPIPYTDELPRYLKNINFNLAKGTEAINKIINFAAKANIQQPVIFTNEFNEVKSNNEDQYKSNIVSSEDVIAFKSWKKSAGSSYNVDSLFKDLRDEKDKRQRAENQVKTLKDELKKAKCTLQENEAEIQFLNQEISKKREKILNDEEELQSTNKKCEELLKELKIEKSKQKDAEKEICNIRTAMKQNLFGYENILHVQKLLEQQIKQNEKLLTDVSFERNRSQQLEKKLNNIEKQLELKQKLANQCSIKLRQLIVICDKMKNQIIISNNKNEYSKKQIENWKVQNIDLMARVNDLLSMNKKIEKELCVNKQNIIINKENYNTKITSLENDVHCLKQRVFKLVDINKKQENLISSQNETIERKQQQLWSAFNEISRIQQCFQTILPTTHKTEYVEGMEKSISDLRKQSENDKQTLLIKDKIIDDQVHSIDDLKKNLASCGQEVFDLQKALSVSKRELGIQKNINEDLTTKLKAMHQKKEELRQQLLELESELEEFQWKSQCSSRDEQLLEKLEKQVMERQKEWEIQISDLNEKLEAALKDTSTAKEMLQEKEESYEKELRSQRHIQCILEKTISDNEIKLTIYEEKINNLNEEIKRRTDNFENATSVLEEKLLKASEVCRDAVMQIKAQSPHDI
uniref:Uncharacterized protein n=1 Tax=Clastoptera arizonana TaxID=38151 RepID=A0A1B6DB39_9HEMI